MDEKDLPFIKGLNKILDEGTFHLKKKEVPAFAAICKWAEQLEKRVVLTKSAPKPAEQAPKKRTKKK